VRPAPPEPARPDGLPALHPGVVPPEDAATLVRAFGIEPGAAVVCAGEDAAARAGHELGYPAVAKLVDPEVTHKSDVGGVRVGLGDERALRAAARELLEGRPDARVLVQPEASGVEVIVGGFRDPQFGPVVVAGLGGVLVEVLGDSVLRLAPVDEDEAAAALRSLRGFPLLAGARGSEAADLDALAGAVAGVSRLLAAVPEVTELDLNPVLASPRGATAVDVRIVVDAPVADGEDSTAPF
jgi:hypothetical protein